MENQTKSTKERIRMNYEKLRQEQGETVTSIEQKTGINKGSISRIFNAETLEPRADTLKKIAEVFDMSADELMKKVYGKRNEADGVATPATDGLPCEFIGTARSDVNGKVNVEWQVRISGNISDITPEVIEKIEKKLRELVGNSDIKNDYFTEGSVILGFESSMENFKRIQALFESGELKDLSGFPVLDVKFIAADTAQANENTDVFIDYTTLEIPRFSPTRYIVNLDQWLKNVFESDWQKFEEVLGAKAPRLAFRNRANIQSFIEHIYTGKTETDRQKAAKELGAIDTKNPEVSAMLKDVIEALIHLICTTENEETRWTAAESLWTIDPGNPAAGVKRVKDLGMQLWSNSVALMVAILDKNNDSAAIFLRVYPMNNQVYLPPNLKLTVLDTSGKTFLETKARNADNLIQLKFSGNKGERFSVKVVLGEANITQDFVI